MENLIIGDRDIELVFIDGKELNPKESQKVYNHSPDGFNWGYGGSDPAQLALAIMLEFTDKQTALKLYQRFKWDIISILPQTNFSLKIDIKKWIKERR